MPAEKDGSNMATQAQDMTGAAEEAQGRHEKTPGKVRQLLADAANARATDIHVDPVNDGFRIAFRVDGILQGHGRLGAEDGRHLLNQIKVAAQFTPDRTFKPLEGRLTRAAEASTPDVRLTLIPTVAGEAAHLRLLETSSDFLQASELGLSQVDLDSVRRALRQREGLILITGPTGSGKTMTLYALASLLDLEHALAASIEDPVEFDLENVRQIQVDPSHDLTMALGLRTLLRSDPDILLVGEIRDEASAVTAVRAAASGRFVLATLHARDIPLAVQSCRYYGVPRHLLGNTLQMVVNQDLVRRLCTQCARPRKPSDEEKKQFEAMDLAVPDQVFDATGCEACHAYGYVGRIGIFDTLPIHDRLRSAIARAASMDDVRKAFDDRTGGLLGDALAKAAAGTTSVREAHRVARA